MKGFYCVMRHLTLTFVLWMGLISYAHSQYLHYSKLGHRLKANYHINDDIAFILRETGDSYRGTITGFTDSTIVFNNYEFAPSEISHIYLDGKIGEHFMFKYKWSRILIISGVGYTGLELLNYGKIDQRNALAGLSLVAAGLVAQLLVRKKYPVDDQYRLTIIHSPSRPSIVPDQEDE